MDNPLEDRPPAIVPTVLAIGDVMLDIIAAPQRSIQFATDTPATITLLPGGSGANVAAWLGHFGNDVRFVGRVGHATFAEHAAALRAHGVQPLFARDNRTRTGMLVTLLSKDGERSFLTDRGANAFLERADLPDTLLDRVRHVHVSGYALLTPGPRAAVLDFLSVATDRRIPFSVDPGSVACLRDIGPAPFMRWTQGAQLCFANAAEAAELAGSNDLSEQLAALRMRYETLVVTCGAAGAHAITARGTHLSTAASVAASIDTSGAGDAFLAGFLTAHLRGEALEGCLHAGVQAGTSAVVAYGGRPPRGTPFEANMGTMANVPSPSVER